MLSAGKFTLAVSSHKESWRLVHVCYMFQQCRQPETEGPGHVSFEVLRAVPSHCREPLNSDCRTHVRDIVVNVDRSAVKFSHI